MDIKWFAIFIAVSASLATANTPGLLPRIQREVQRENFYNSVELAVFSNDSAAIKRLHASLMSCHQDCKMMRSLFITAIETGAQEGLNPQELLKGLDLSPFESAELLRIHVSTGDPKALETLQTKTDLEGIDPNLESVACAHSRLEFTSNRDNPCGDHGNEPLTRQQIRDLFNVRPNLEKYLDGRFADSVRIFMFCRQDREYPCLMIMRDKKGNPVRDAKGRLWNQPALALSKHHLPYNMTNGQTPQGIYQIDGIMPAADRPEAFGKHHRLILDFVEPSLHEQNFKYLLPASHLHMNWWTQSITARDIGRGLFRIHGTGRMNPDPTVPFYPFMPTSGCVSKRENTYNNVDYEDQRVLLDTLLKALKLNLEPANELLIKGLLYVVEMDDVKGPVKLKTLNDTGIY